VAVFVAFRIHLHLRWAVTCPPAQAGLLPALIFYGIADLKRLEFFQWIQPEP
jgi:hypothetical protein